MRWFALICMAGLVAGCETTTEASRPSQPAPAKRTISKPTSAQVAQFSQVVSRVEPVAEQQCRARSSSANCDFKIVVDDRPGQPPNAFQTLDRSGRPILAFTLALIADARNQDELAFIMGHEAAHHISGHIPRQQTNAMAGAVLAGIGATLLGAGSSGVDAAADLGASVGSRSYSKNYELEADALGTVISKRAGYNPVRGAQYFARIPDPGDRFLGTHPPNAKRIETVKRVNANL